MRLKINLLKIREIKYILYLYSGYIINIYIFDAMKKLIDIPTDVILAIKKIAKKEGRSTKAQMEQILIDYAQKRKSK